MRLIIITVILFPITCSFLWSRLTAVASLVDALAYLCALRARRMSEIPSPASSSSDGDEDLTYEEILEEASMDAHSAANTCSCGEHSSMRPNTATVEECPPQGHVLAAVCASMLASSRISSGRTRLLHRRCCYSQARGSHSSH